jgi:hypothetical protein
LTVTVPDDDEAFGIGQRVDVVRFGSGALDIEGEAGVTVRGTPSLILREQYSTVSIVKIASNDWLVVGDLAAV